MGSANINSLADSQTDIRRVRAGRPNIWLWCLYCLYPQVWVCLVALDCPPPTPPTPTPLSTQIPSTLSCWPGGLTGRQSSGQWKIIQGKYFRTKIKTKNIFRLVESQRMESLRQAEARATSFLSPFSKGKTFFFNLKRNLWLSPS